MIWQMRWVCMSVQGPESWTYQWEGSQIIEMGHVYSVEEGWSAWGDSGSLKAYDELGCHPTKEAAMQAVEIYCVERALKHG